MIKSQKIAIVRYTNGTLVKLTPSATSFQSTNYDGDDTTPTTYHPPSISIEGKTQGDLSIASWQYSYDGSEWYPFVNGEKGVVLSGNTIVIQPTDSLFDENGFIIVRANGSDPQYYDTVTIAREVNPTYVYDSMRTLIDQTNGKISLIASETQIAQFTEESTMVDRMASIEETAVGVRTLVVESYATKDEVTQRYSEIEQDVAGIQSTVSTKVGTDEIISRINQSAEQVSIDAGKVNLNGAVIVERINDTTANVSIDADKIDLNGAVTANNYFKINTDGSFEALQGLIGAIHVIASAIYSGSHSTPASANDGFYLGADGSVSIGNEFPVH